jgi:hypothetical protein
LDEICLFGKEGCYDVQVAHVGLEVASTSTTSASSLYLEALQANRAGLANKLATVDQAIAELTAASEHSAK